METTTIVSGTTQIVRPERGSFVKVTFAAANGAGTGMDITTIFGTVTATDEDSLLIVKAAEWDNEEPVAIEDGELWSLFDLEQADPLLVVEIVARHDEHLFEG